MDAANSDVFYKGWINDSLSSLNPGITYAEPEETES
jgi:hypothetical protein